MAITSGFFNSLSGDRKYDARQMGEMFDGLIEDGVFMSIGDALKTVPSSGMTVAVGTGRAWFLHTWTKNDSDHLITVSAAESVLNRIDTIVLDIDNTEATRDNDIVLVKGTPSSNPKRPILIDADDHKQIPLADILVPAGSTALTATNITNIVGTSECPYVTGPLSIIKNDDILEAWQEEFDTWFDGVKGTLGSDTAGNLYNLIQQKVDKTSVLDTMDEVNLATEKGLVAGALAIKELNGKMTGSFSASDIQSAVASGVRGGWKRIGDIVFIDVKFNLVASYKDAAIMKKLPVPRNDNTAFSAANLSAGRVAYGRVNSNGDLEWHDSEQPATGNECSITGIYNCV